MKFFSVFYRDCDMFIFPTLLGEIPILHYLVPPLFFTLIRSYFIMEQVIDVRASNLLVSLLPKYYTEKLFNTGTLLHGLMKKVYFSVRQK